MLKYILAQVHNRVVLKQVTVCVRVCERTPEYAAVPWVFARRGWNDPVGAVGMERPGRLEPRVLHLPLSKREKVCSSKLNFAALDLQIDQLDAAEAYVSRLFGGWDG